MESQRFQVGRHGFTLGRAAGGVARIEAPTELDRAAGMGYVHGRDRWMQMALFRLVSQGRISECLTSEDSALEVDVFTRTLGLNAYLDEDLALLDVETRAWVDAYCEGVNAAVDREGIPFELRLLRVPHEPWTPRDSVQVIKAMSFLGLAQVQIELEKTILQAVKNGSNVAQLKTLFAPFLDDLDDAAVARIRQLKIANPILPQTPFLEFVPTLVSSNNWVVAPSRSASGSALHANDPHLDINRLPAIWCELIVEGPDQYQIGISLPGIPGVVMGRNREVHASFSYGYMDMVDYFVEDVRLDSGSPHYRRGERHLAFRTRTEVIRRKGKPEHRITLHENDLGVLEVDEPSNGLHLLRAWTAYRGGMGASLNSLRRTADARDVHQAQAALREVRISCNWLISDRAGNIAYQQSGLQPKRVGQGLVPLPAWDERNHWSGFVDPQELAHEKNPADGFLATANHPVANPGRLPAITTPVGPYRIARIRSKLSEKSLHSLEDLAALQADLYSLQAEALLQQMRPWIPKTGAGEILLAWDLRYDSNSRGATLFEAIYDALQEEILGKRVFGPASWKAIRHDSSIPIHYYAAFDRALLSDDPSWFAPETKESLFRRVIAQTLEANPRPQAWGHANRYRLDHLLLGNKLPIAFGFSKGPFPMEGGRATVVQGGRYRMFGAEHVVGVSVRMLADMATDEVRSALPGGPSDRRFSRYYASDVKLWRTHRYKTLSARAASSAEPATAR